MICTAYKQRDVVQIESGRGKRNGHREKTMCSRFSLCAFLPLTHPRFASVTSTARFFFPPRRTNRTLCNMQRNRAHIFVFPFLPTPPVIVAALGVNSIFFSVAALFRDIVQKGEPTAIRAESGHGDRMQKVDRCDTRR